MPESCVPPEIDAELLFYIRAFWTLSSDRALGMAVGPIPWTAIDRYAERLGIIDDEVEYTDFVEIIQTLDVAFMKQQQTDAPKEAQRGKRKRG